MRTLSATLAQAQRDQGFALCKAVFTGANTYTYDLTTTNRLLKVTHPEQAWSQTAKILVDDVDLTLSGLSLEGYTVTLSYGYNTSAGDEYSACAPLKVKGQELVTSGGIQQCLLDCYGFPDQMGHHHAQSDLSLTSDDNRTVKTLISAIMGATLAPFSHLTAITVTYDSEDSLIDTFTPNDYFRITTGDTQKAKIQELLAYTKCVGIFKADGAFHIFNPTVSGVTYDYEYNDTFLAANHTFLSRVYRNRLVIPSKVTIMSSADHSPIYTGSATDAASYALIPGEQDFQRMRLTSSAQAQTIAEAKIQRLQVDHERGNGFAPMNCGQEVYDYINVTASLPNNSRAGNTGYLVRTWDADARDPFTIGFGFGDIMLGGAIGIGGISGSGSISQPSYATWNDLKDFQDLTYDNLNILLDRIEALEKREKVDKWHVSQQLIIPVI